MARGVSTILDVVVCLLLIGAAITTLTLHGLPTTESNIDSDPVARQLLTSTASIPTETHTVDSTLAGHLAWAAIDSLQIDNDTVFAQTYPTVVTTHVNNTIDEQVSVIAIWKPFGDLPITGVVQVGTTPPPTATVSSTTVTVPLTQPHGRNGQGTLEDRAQRVVDLVFPPRQTRQALLNEHSAAHTANRYRSLSSVLGISIESYLFEGDAHGANARLATALADNVSTAQFAVYPQNTAGLSATSVQIQIRRWGR